MTQAEPQAQTDAPRDLARRLIEDTLTVARVARWCCVAENTVRQWLSRGSDREPIPPRQVAPILAGARQEGLDAPVGILWPALGEALADA